MKKMSVLFAAFVIAMQLITACQPKATETPVEPVAPTPPVEAPAGEPTKPVEPTKPAEPVGEAPLKLIMVQHALCAWDAFWCTVEDGIQTAAKDMGVEVTVLGPDKFDLEKTAALIDQAIAAQPDGIGLTVTDPVLFKEPIMKALDAGIPVLAYNAGKGPVLDDISYMTYLGMDEYQGGYQSGQRMIAAGGTRGVCINHQVGHAGLDLRCKGLIDAFAEAGLTAEVLGVKGEDAAQSQTTISDFYTANPEVDSFLTLGPSSANPFYAFVEASQPQNIKHITFDLTPEVEAKIKDGTTIAAVDQQPFLQGYGAVMYLVLNKRYGITPALPVTATGPGFITEDLLGATVDPEKPVKLIMVQHALCAWDAFWCTVEDGIQTAAKDMGVEVTVLGPDKFDLEKTAALIDQAIAAQPDGIGLTVTDPVLFKEPIMKALDAGIPVLAYNAGKGPVLDGISYMTYLGMDEYQGGYQSGQRMIAAGGIYAARG
ncbi:MAG: substrate-binding domain-containing protein [Bellilinea sp.]